MNEGGFTDSATTITDVTITGAGSVDLDAVTLTAATTVDASASTGDVDVAVNGTATSVTTGTGDDSVNYTAALAATAAIATGAGNDMVTVNGALTAGATIDGGADTDTLGLTSAVATGATADTEEDVFSNFERIEITNALAANLDVSVLDDIQSVILNDVNDATPAGVDNFTISGLNSGSTVEHQATLTHASDGITITVDGAAASTSDEVNLVLNAGATADFGTAAVANVETVNINSTTTAADPTAVTNTIDVTAAAATTVAVTGDAALDISAVALSAVTTLTGHDAGLTADISGGTDDQTVTLGAGDDTVTLGNGANTVTAGAGDDNVTGGTAVDTIDGGDGDDTIDGDAGADILTGGAGADTFVYNAVGDSSGTGIDIIQDFVSGTDKIDLSAITAATDTYLGEANGITAANTALTAGGGIEAVLDTSNNQLYVDANDSGDIGAGDLVIELSGVTDLESADFVF